MRLFRHLAPRQSWTRGALRIVAASAVIAVVLGAGTFMLLRSSLPVLEGTITAPELAAPVGVVRDAQGVPTLVGRSRDDLAWALGYLHAQERFFQMDGQRRLAAGQVAELAGAAVLSRDRELRVHRFRSRAAKVLAAMTRDERRVLDAYVAGVNRGLGDLGAAPFEYTLLRATPAPWTAEDTVLTVYAMYLDLQERDGATERRRGRAREALGQPLAAFLFPEGTSWDASLDGSSCRRRHCRTAMPSTKRMYRSGPPKNGPRRQQVSAATTGWWEAVSAAAGRPSLPTTCISACGFPTSGTEPGSC